MSTALTGTNGTNVPDVLNLTIHNLATPPSSLTPQDLLSQAKTSWLFGKAARAVTVKLFKEIMQRCDGRTKNCPPRLDENGKEQRDEHGNVILMTMKEAFASIGIEYEAARKFVYRDKKAQELEALSLQHALTSGGGEAGEKPLFKAGDIVDTKEVTCAEVTHYNVTTGVLDIKGHFGTGAGRRVNAEDVVLLNGLRVVDGEVIVPKVVTLDASVIYLDSATGKKFTYTGGTLKPTQAETKREILAAVKEEKAEAKAAAELTAKKARDAARKEDAEKKDKALIAQAKAEGKKNKEGKKTAKAAAAPPSEADQPPACKVGDKSTPTARGFFHELRLHEKMPYVVRDLNHPDLGILCECHNKADAEMKVAAYEREAAAAAQEEDHFSAASLAADPQKDASKVEEMTFRIERPEGGVGDYERVHKVCVTCGDEFKDKPRNLGLITQCDGCGAKREVPVLKGFTEVEGSKGTTRTVVPVTPDVFDRAVKQARTGSVRTN